MPKLSKQTASTVQDFGVAEDRSEDLDGYTVNFVSIRQDIDLAALPDDRCPCPHWGLVSAGRLTAQFDGREEVYEAGDAFYMPPGHVPQAAAGTEFTLFSPSDLMQRVGAVMAAKMQRMHSAHN